MTSSCQMLSLSCCVQYRFVLDRVITGPEGISFDIIVVWGRISNKILAMYHELINSSASFLPKQKPLWSHKGSHQGWYIVTRTRSNSINVCAWESGSCLSWLNHLGLIDIYIRAVFHSTNLSISSVISGIPIMKDKAFWSGAFVISVCMFVCIAVGCGVRVTIRHIRYGNGLHMIMFDTFYISCYHCTNGNFNGKTFSSTARLLTTLCTLYYMYIAMPRQCRYSVPKVFKKDIRGPWCHQ